MENNSADNELSSWILKRVAHDQVIRLKLGNNSVGRSRSNDICLNSSYCSKQHCELYVNKNYVLLRDFSSNGVYVNTTAYIHTEKRLDHGDRIGFGCNVEDHECIGNNEHCIYYLRFKPQKNPELHDENNKNIEIGLDKNEKEKKEVEKSDNKEDMKANIDFHSIETTENASIPKCSNYQLENANCVDEKSSSSLSSASVAHVQEKKEQNMNEGKSKTIVISANENNSKKQMNTTSISENKAAAEEVGKQEDIIVISDDEDDNDDKEEKEDNSIITEIGKKNSNQNQEKITECKSNEHESIKESSNYHKEIEIIDNKNATKNATDEYCNVENALKENENIIEKKLSSHIEPEVIVNENKNNNEVIEEIEDEENIEMQLSQSITRAIKKEIIDFEYEDLIVINDSDDESDSDFQKNNELFSSKDFIKVENRTDNEEEINRSPIDETDDDDTNLMNWIEKLSQSQGSPYHFHEKLLLEKKNEKKEITEFGKNEPKEKDVLHKKEEKKHKPLQRKVPQIIKPPSLPTKKGKLRGVSAASTSENDRKKNDVCRKIKSSEQEINLKQKWHSKPLMEQREEKRKIKEDRKQKLKELAEEQSFKRKLSESNDDDSVKIVKKPKVKVTHKNRGAFLTEQEKSSSHAFENSIILQDKVPKISKKSIKISESKEETINTTENRNLKRRHSDNGEIRIIENRNLGRRHSIYNEKDSPSLSLMSIQNKNNLPSNTIRKTSFESNFSSSDLIQNLKLKPILKISNSQRKHTKNLCVRFNDKPKIVYFEIEKDSNDIEKKSDTTNTSEKIMSKFLQFTNKKQNRMPLIDHSDEILHEVLKWNPFWLTKQNYNIYPLKQLYPMLHKFSTFEEFKKILFPLMKLELLASIKQDFINNQVLPFEELKISNLYIDSKQHLLIIECLYYPANMKSKIPINVSDLAIIRIGESYNFEEFFTFIRTVKKIHFHNPHYEITLESAFNPNLRELINKTKDLKIKSTASMRIELGAFNAVYALQHSPLLKNILDPSENIKNTQIKQSSIEEIRYKGCDTLNKNQKEILLKTYLRSINNDKPSITLIEGPPGTGKSRVISNLAMQFLYGKEVKPLEKRILICAHSNTATDVICCKLLNIRQRMMSDKFKLTRFGLFERMHKNAQCVSVQRLAQATLKQNKFDKSSLNNEKILLEDQIAKLKNSEMHNSVHFDELQELTQRLQMIERILNNEITVEEEEKYYSRILDGAHIVCTTLSSAMRLLRYTKYFDICIIDEATQCTEQISLIPLQFSISSLILVGDIQQLPATVLSKDAKTLGLGRSLFTRIQNTISQTNLENNCIFQLNEQYRMHPEISRWPNLYFYNNKLKNAEITTKIDVPIVLPYIVLNLSFNQNISDKTGKIWNSLEATFVVNLIQHLSQYISPKNNLYGVITPYAEHREILIKKLCDRGLKEILVNTIDSYQGKERDIIIISNARTRGVGFLANPQRLNVALTRAKKCLILCGNFSNVERISSWNSLLDDAKKRNLLFNINNLDALEIENKIICHIIKKS